MKFTFIQKKMLPRFNEDSPDFKWRRTLLHLAREAKGQSLELSFRWYKDSVLLGSSVICIGFTIRKPSSPTASLCLPSLTPQWKQITCTVISVESVRTVALDPSLSRSQWWTGVGSGGRGCMQPHLGHLGSGIGTQGLRIGKGCSPKGAQRGTWGCPMPHNP